jgi:5'-phosphate synthase pdxT subunit
MAKVGVLGIQGDFIKHVEALQKSGVDRKEIVIVRTHQDLEIVDRLIIPGGESTTVGMLLRRYQLGDAIIARAERGMPIWGTCMGMILMSREILDHPHQYCLKLLDIKVRRNAFGRQINSFEDALNIEGFDRPVVGVFIRAPIVEEVGSSVQAIATYNGKIVAVRQGHLLGTSFHSELTEDSKVHEFFMSF